MTPTVRARCEARANMLKALGHPTRFFIVEKLAGAPHCVCELTALIGADTSTVSKHLTVLKQAGLVQDEKRGLLVYYSLKHDCVAKILGCVEKTAQAEARTRYAMAGAGKI